MFATRHNQQHHPFKDHLFSAITEAARFSIYYGKYIASPPEERRKITVKHGI
ncbi:MAG: hypothetical protein ACP5D7_19960 [Limnospira sp.]